MDHLHQWRATSKVFALVCECGSTYHEWLLAEIDRLKASSTPAFPQPPSLTLEISALEAQLSEAHRERDALRTELTEARAELERRAATITQSVATTPIR